MQGKAVGNISSKMEKKMPCYGPITAYRLTFERTKNNASVIVFSKSQVNGKPYIEMQMACGQCIGCRIDISRQWAIRCLHEAQTHGINNNYFLTLTYDDEHLNPTGTLVKRDLQNFMKEVRRQKKGARAVEDKKNNKIRYPIRFFQCGEYGEACKYCGQTRKQCYCKKYTAGLGRPHHHVCLFNIHFSDLTLQEEKEDNKFYTSTLLGNIWKKGYHVITDLNFSTAAYTARYCCKKVTGKKQTEHYKRCDHRSGRIEYVEPEYLTMSRRPGIGRLWYDKYRTDLFPKDFITDQGKTFKVPKYYNKLYEETYPHKFEEIKRERRKRAYANKSERTLDRLEAKRKVKQSQLSQLKRDQV